MTKRFSIFFAAAAVYSQMLATPVLAAHIESTDGDLSNDPNAPTFIDFSSGENVITGVISSSNADTNDFFTFTIEPGEALTEINLLVYADAAGGFADIGFNAINAGNTSLSPSFSTRNFFLGGGHLEAGLVGTDLLPAFANGLIVGSGFTTPLGPGDYSYVVQQNGDEVNNYSLEFVVAAVPEPTSLALMSIGLIGALRRRR